MYDVWCVLYDGMMYDVWCRLWPNFISPLHQTCIRYLLALVSAIPCPVRTCIATRLYHHRISRHRHSIYPIHHHVRIPRSLPHWAKRRYNGVWCVMSWCMMYDVWCMNVWCMNVWMYECVQPPHMRKCITLSQAHSSVPVQFWSPYVCLFCFVVSAPLWTYPWYDVWCMMYAWCMMYDVWCMMYDVWCMIYDV